MKKRTITGKSPKEMKNQLEDKPELDFWNEYLRSREQRAPAEASDRRASLQLLIVKLIPITLKF